MKLLLPPTSSAACHFAGMVASALVVFASNAEAGVNGSIRFNRDIRPILSDNCFSCHGPDKGHRKGGLRLDLREEALKPAKSGEIAVVPGKPEESELLKRLVSADKDELMPPEESHKTITAAQRELLKEWIRQGANYEAHWAYIPPVKAPTPELKNSEWARNPVDRFIQARLEEKNIVPSREADRGALLRRLSLDLNGVPPTVEELHAFQTDSSPEAYLKQVERLLNSPRFGERMASQWLDLARYADTVGFHGDQNQNAWAYRDWVISSFNRNQPFDQFTIEQLAGDLLPNPTPEQLTATCFNRLNMMTREGGAQPKEYLAKYTADRVRTVGMTWLGSTFNCAECHDHKFDPISTRDFYSIGAFFADVKQWGVYANYGYTPEPELIGVNNESPFFPEITVESEALKKRAAAYKKQISDLANQAEISPEALAVWRKNLEGFLKDHPDGFAEQVVSKKQVSAEVKAEGKESESKTGETAKPNKKSDSKASKMELEVCPQRGSVASIALTLQPDHEKGKITRSGKDTTVRVSFRLVHKGKGQPLKVRHAVADRFKPEYKNGFEEIGVEREWKTNGPESVHRAVYILEDPLTLEEGDKIEVSLQTGDGKVPDCELTEVGVALSLLVPSEGSGIAMPLSFGDETALRLSYLKGSGANREVLTKIKSVESGLRECRDGKTPVMVTRSTDKPLTVRILPRGNWMDESGEPLSPETPHFLPKALGSSEPKTRLDLARWLVSEQNPLTARVVVNRMWRQFFGNALSIQPDELGSQGEPPSHPELLDWLSVEFREQGWDIKHLIRLLVTSHTYRQSAQLRSELREIDPGNRLLASQNPRRLEAESVRDNALAIAGLLNNEMGGPPVKPYQPPGYYQALQFPNRDYVASLENQQYRRGVYSHWQRTFLHPMLANFDAPSREDCVALRSNANTPQQALTLLNDPSFVEAARFWAARILQNPKLSTDQERLGLMSVEALTRPFNQEEKERLIGLLQKVRDEYRTKPDDAARLLKVGNIATPKELDPVEVAVWTNICRVVLNLHETITRY